MEIFGIEKEGEAKRVANILRIKKLAQKRSNEKSADNRLITNARSMHRQSSILRMWSLDG